MKKYLLDVRQMHTKFGLPVREPFRKLSEDEAQFRYGFLVEELLELEAAQNLVDILDALIDLAYVANGTMLYIGYREEDIPPGPLWTEAVPFFKEQVHNASLNGDWGWFFNKQVNDVLLMDLQSTPLLALYKLYAITSTCMRIFEAMGYNWEEHWDEVHRANMDKERCSPKNPSSRGITDGSDCVKPEGWRPPNHYSIIYKEGKYEHQALYAADYKE